MDKSSIEDICPLSPMQDGLLFQSLYDPDPEAYFVQINFRFRGELKQDAFREAWHLLSGRHAALRSAFVHEGLSRPVQVVLKQRPPEITFTSLEHLAPGERDQHIDQFKRQDRRRGFDLVRDVLMRIAVFQIQPDEHHVLWSFHHILLDGWCLSILQSEFMLTYPALIQSRTPDLPPVFPYGNYLRWLESQDREEARRYWREYLAGYQGPAGIPQLGHGGNDEGYALRELMVELDADVTAALRGVAARAGVTFNTLVQCIWAIVLGRYNDVPDVIFGMIVSGRPPDLTGVEQMVGLCINAVPVRIRLKAHQPFIGLLQDTQKAALESQSRHHLPLAEILTQSPLGGKLFDHLLTFENYPVKPASYAPGDPGGATFAIEPLGAHDRTHYPFTFIATPGDKLHIRFSFNANVYPEDQMRRTREHFLTAVRSVLNNANLSVADVNILPEGERIQVLYDFNDTWVKQTYEPGLVGRFEAQVDRTPNRTAVVCEDRRLTYQELNERANQLAHYLRYEHDLQPDDRVGLWLDRSEQLVVAIWEILKAGAAYVPIDPDYPPERQRHMLSDSKCRSVITEEKYADQALRAAAPAIVDIRCFPSGNPENPPPISTSTHLAYVMYTSGSTGAPKGCQIELGNLVHYLCWADGFYFKGHEGGCFGLYSPLSFDLTVTSLYLPLLRGKTLCVFPADTELLDVFEQTFRDDSPIDSIKLTPSHITLLRYLQPRRSNIRLAIVGGEALKLEHVTVLRGFNPWMAIYNEYGPTETTVGCVVKRIENSDERVLIGKPIANTRIYILRDSNPLPIGTIGEVFIGGAGVGRGYINREELNRQTLMRDPYMPDGRLYRTGDLGRWLPDGNLELLGRADHQVKIRGYRIELGEIEQQLVRHALLRDAVVTVRDQNELVAFLTPVDRGTLNFDQLREHLAAVLPDYMIPSQFIELDEFPLTVNGKVNRQALANLAAARPRVGGKRTMAASTEISEPSGTTAEMPPRTATEKALAGIWQVVLGQERIGIRDNFFHLGGHSLKAIQVLWRTHQQLGRKISLRDLFSHPTIEAVAQLIDAQSPNVRHRIEPAPPRETYPLSDAQKQPWLADRMGSDSSLNIQQAIAYRGRVDGRWSPIPVAPRQDTYALSHAQRRLWMLHQMQAGAAYNMPDAYLIKFHIDVELLKRAFRTLIARHEALRTAIVTVDGEPRQQIWADLPFSIAEYDLREMGPAAEREARVIADRQANLSFNLSFNLSQPPLLRVTVVHLPQVRSLLLLTMHHIIGDGWSGNLVYREILSLYDAYRHGRAHPLRPLRIQYKDFAHWQNARGFAEQERYWTARLAGMPDRLLLPYDFAPEGARDFSGATEAAELSTATTLALRQVAVRRGTTLSNVILALFKLMLFRWTRQNDICVGVSAANRDHPDLENLIGFFVNILPIHCRLDADMEFDDLLDMVTERTGDAMEHQDYPLDLMIQTLNPQRRANRQPLVNVVYGGFQDLSDVQVDVATQSAAPIQAPPTGSEPVWSEFEFSFPKSKFDLTLLVAGHAERIRLILEYDSSLFLAATIRNQVLALAEFAGIVAGVVE